METRYEITEKQLAFLEDYLLRKYPSITDETRIELVDHLVSDFEKTTENGNLSQYLSNELGFIKQFIFDKANTHQKSYGKQTWKQFYSFLTDIKLLPITFSTLIIFYFLNENLVEKWSWGSLAIIQLLIFLASIIFGVINKKEFKKLDEIKYLSTDIWLPYIMVQLPSSFGFDNFIMSNSFSFTFYASFTIIYAISAFIVIREKRKIILEKYKHLLN
ncbi:hypothetical protein [Polaribacter sp. AHE13PA]|jgi:hypothetical protein|uniref:hypothetical protein n=1 Tax=Polaribacter sp. AHE13PA TaxID=2745562 RepID=UPI001C4FA4F3|nr:hypothetical protein [Polaribacter sp. AHE13PA]QXP66123.1 hypothetical protein H0I28_13120 [Polaribacter sp. AHE13PA]